MTEHLNIPLARAPKSGEAPLSIEDLEQVAAGAGHGHGHLSFGEQPSPWFSLADNVRPCYDLRFIQTFNPLVVRHLLDRLRAAEDTLAEHGITAPNPEEHRIALLTASRDTADA